jgi:hypothetical protein
MPQPSHFQDLVAVGEVAELIYARHQLRWIVLVVDVTEPVYVPVQPPPTGVPAGLAKHDLLWLRGVLAVERQEGARRGLPYVVARHLDRLRRGRAPTAGSGANGANSAAGGDRRL